MMSRMAKFGTRNAAKVSNTEPVEELEYNDEKGLPPRRVKHPSNKQQTAQWFYNSLFLLFLFLIVILFLFGKNSITAS
ncbi:hypothetical protein PCURB6_08720 [Paenibacillus curdlanolyticus]|nr:hypothetical protein PCURB6_08720 [Paenibacillus curdlanolyticus]